METLTRTLAPGVRTTIWVNQDVPAAAAYDASTMVDATAPIYVERAWRQRSPGRTAAHDSVSRGAAVPSTWWYFAIGSLSEPFDTSFALFNPSGQQARVEARFLFADRSPDVRTLELPAGGRLIVKPRELGIGGASAALVLHAADAVGIVAERTTDGVTASSAWRQSALGVTEAGVAWAFADATGTNDWVIANPSDTDARVRLFFATRFFNGDDAETIVFVPAGRVVTFPFSMYGGTLEATSEPTTGGAPATPIVIERARYVDVDGVSRARQVSIAGNVIR